jgi:hypothetical protein
MIRTLGTAWRILGPSLDGIVENRADDEDEGWKRGGEDVLM